MPETTPAEPGAAARRARWAVTAYFVVSGFALATWTARIPTIKQDLGLDDGGVTLALFAVAAGSVLAMQVCGHLTDRFGSARVVPPAGALVALSGLAPGLADGLGTLVAGLVVFGAAHGTIDVAMNSHAVRVEQRYRRPIMSTFHATFSLGGLLGAGSGALAAHLGMSPAAHFALTGAALLALSLLARPALLPPEPAPPAADGPRVRGFPMAIVFLGALGFFCSVGEGSMADWSSVYLHDELGTGTGFAALGYAVFSATMGLFRFLGDGLVRRFGPVPLVRVCGVVAGSGLGVALLLHHPVAALGGFALFGVGLSCIVPQIFSAAGHRDPARSGRDLAQVSTLSYGGLLAGPVFIGLLAQGFGLSVGLAVPAALALLVAVAAGAVRPEPATAAAPGRA
ncbi:MULTISPECIES: MFS transporter [unclassified Saccharopolyspora]|uniref:MFS transporter n=1 Tax=unclassified Saccharopolyspora TaxID=2646250 RepID=UPI001CD41B3B|nr:MULTISPECIES: MFS transporter [unclassified Saccharopolyspora]MCA1188799.1 MFS transporter [Saccharopolyspora sp. 6T]MCA1195791.1 MFS transporter [Saccharopolyspora sp. 6V]MCA1226557.1 MFS transporter [Saccharopolyspora sp. 6M]MCA1283175.1 MFS transporter [Saccharopolyspora sp. 7B]